MGVEEFRKKSIEEDLKKDCFFNLKEFHSNLKKISWINEEEKRNLFNKALLSYLQTCKEFENCYSKLEKIPWINELEKDSLRNYYNSYNRFKF